MCSSSEHIYVEKPPHRQCAFWGPWRREGEHPGFDASVLVSQPVQDCDGSGLPPTSVTALPVCLLMLPVRLQTPGDGTSTGGRALALTAGEEEAG